MYAIRNIKLCTKDCLCLYVCPTGATDTETGQIDALKCLDGCHACVDACPSNAISLIPNEFPAQQIKSDEVKSIMFCLSDSKAKQERIAAIIAGVSDNTVLVQLLNAINLSNRIMTEDILRESGYMLPQSENVRNLLHSMAEETQPEDFPLDSVEKLLTILEKRK